MTKLKTAHLNLPATTADLAALEIGTVVYLAGRLFTAREGVYKRAVEDGLGMPASPEELGRVNFHCSPAASIDADGKRTVGAVTATASFRFAKYLDGWFKASTCNIIIGKGGMTSEVYRRSFVPNQCDLFDDGRLWDRSSAWPRHQTCRQRLLAQGTRPCAGGLGARR